jgi:hypothetical protein
MKVAEQDARGALTVARREGVEAGIELGEVKGKRDSLLRLLARAGITLSEAQRTIIETCTDPKKLDQWFDRAIGAKTADDVFGQ